ncbi:MAG: division/cell wall cluster transcriptional repressor MraZ, partial [Atopobium sp.]|nr:division/cell wall cluster transcriptional repressor MraZ [Atopobium sp.]
IVGNGDHFEIWNTNKWNSLFSADDRVATLEDLIFGA